MNSIVAEEIESLSRTDKRAIQSHLALICLHLLKWQFRPAARSNSWRTSVVRARIRIANLLDESLSLRQHPATVLSKAYADGRRMAEAETGIDDLPIGCPWTTEQLLDHQFWP